MLWHYLLFIVLFGVTSVRAEGWEDFADNFATDLAPLVALFGERLTKQFLSESTSILDNFIFALSPLGILTAVVSVIRICGNSSLRAFVGRANEAPGEAENELLSCVSEGTAELFNDGGISRVFGRPSLLEVVVWEENGSYKLGTLRDALQDGAWVPGGTEQVHHDENGIYALSELDIPNLSLNKGIERRGRGWFYAAAMLGTTLQGGTLVFAAITFFKFSDHFQKNGSSPDSYSFPVYLFGTTSLSLGMFLCAFIIERSSSEAYLYPTKPSKIYWLQPGRQTIGDQDFGAFLAVNEGHNSQLSQDLVYIKSVRGPAPKGKRPLLVFTICVTMVGFVMQFIGLRGLHPSVIIADVGSTLLMAVVRTCLRTKRLSSDENIFKDDRELLSHNQQELDSFAFHLEKVQSFRLVSSPVHQTARSRSRSCSTSDSSIVSTQPSGLGVKLIQTRARLSELTSSNRHPSMDWDDLPIRKVAHDLANTIEMTMEVVSRWKEIPGSTYSFELSFACQALSHKSTGSSLETYSIELRRSEDTFQWRVDANELEAILGLWTFSLLKSNSKWRQTGLGRAVGLTKAEAGAEATDLYFHKWIFRQREAKMVSSKMISFSEQTFGYYSEDYPDVKEILVVKTDNSLEVMAAQDIYIQFLMNILTGLNSLGGDVDILPVSQNTFLAQSSYLDELVASFETENLGSREDALTCIVPVLKHKGLLPELAGDSKPVRERVETLISSGNWDGAFAVTQWLCERCDGDEFERSVYELGFLCQKAMLHKDVGTRERGDRLVRSLLQTDIRESFFRNLRSHRQSQWMSSLIRQLWWTDFSKQLGWVSWHIACASGDRHGIKAFLEGLGLTGQLTANPNADAIEKANVNVAQLTYLGRLIPILDSDPRQMSVYYEDERCIEICVEWVTTNAKRALCHWMLAHWIETTPDDPHQLMKAFVYAAKSKSDIAIEILRRRGADIDMPGETCRTALLELVDAGNKEAAERLLVNGADPNACVWGTNPPLNLAAGQGNVEITKLLLDHRADIEIRDSGSFTPLHTACAEYRFETAALLIERGANVNSIAHGGNSPFLAATAKGNLDMVRFLLDRGANINAADHDGNTALMLAVCEGFETIIRFLIDRGADTQKHDYLGRTALDSAKEFGTASIIAVLEGASF
ncbi:hypothetical protein BJX70DRAFT_409320 [Aspergillus crustosus]